MVGLLIGISSDMLSDNDFGQRVITFVTLPNVYPYLLGAVGLDILLLSTSGWSYRRYENRTHRKQLESQFEFITKSELLTPEMMGFERLQPGEQTTTPGRRPFYPNYIERTFIPGEKETDAEDSQDVFSESYLRDLVRKGVSIVLLGVPTTGKTRTMYEILRKIPEILIMKPRRDMMPSREALELCCGKKTVLLLDDLNEYASDSLDIELLKRRLDELGIENSIACTCRNGSELSVIKEATSNSIRKVWEQIPVKLTLRLPTKAERMALAAAVSPSRETDEMSATEAPTLGAIVMADALRIMRERFELLPYEHKDCLAAMQMLVFGGVLPLTTRRISAVMGSVFERTSIHLRDILSDLDHQGFIRSGTRNPVFPEMAYIRSHGSRSVVSNSLGISDREQLQKLVAVFEDSGDLEAAFYSAITAGDMGYPHDELEAYERLVSQFNDSSDPNELLWLAKIMVNRGRPLGRFGRHEEALAAYDEVISRFGKARSSALNEQVANALLNKGAVVNELGNNSVTLEQFDEVIARFSGESEPGIRRLVTLARLNKSKVLQMLGRGDEGIQICERVFDDFAGNDRSELRELAANALFNKGFILVSVQRYDEAIAVCDELVSHFESDSDSRVKHWVAMALNNKAFAFSKLGQLEEAVEGYEQVLQRFGNSPELRLKEEVAIAMVNMGLCLENLNRSDEALDLYNDVVARFGRFRDDAIREKVAKAMFFRGLLPGKRGQFADAATALNHVIREFGADENAEIIEIVANALFHKGFALKQISSTDEMNRTFDKLTTQYGSHESHAVRLLVAKSLIEQGDFLAEQNRLDEALEVWDNVFPYIEDNTEPDATLQLGKMLVGRGFHLAKAGRQSDAVEAYDDVLRRFKDVTDKRISVFVVGALYNKHEALIKAGRRDDAISALCAAWNRLNEASEELRGKIESAFEKLEIDPTDCSSNSGISELN